MHLNRLKYLGRDDCHISAEHLKYINQVGWCLNVRRTICSVFTCTLSYGTLEYFLKQRWDQRSDKLYCKYCKRGWELFRLQFFATFWQICSQFLESWVLRHRAMTSISLLLFLSLKKLLHPFLTWKVAMLPTVTWRCFPRSQTTEVKKTSVSSRT